MFEHGKPAACAFQYIFLVYHLVSVVHLFRRIPSLYNQTVVLSASSFAIPGIFMRKHFIAMNRELYEKRTPPVSVYLKLMEPPFRHLYSVDSEIQKMVIQVLGAYFQGIVYITIQLCCRST